MENVGYCRNSARNKKSDFDSIMNNIVSDLQQCEDAASTWVTAMLPLKLYFLFVKELSKRNVATKIQKAISYAIEETLLLNIPCSLKKITGPNGLLLLFPNGKEKNLLDYICKLPQKTSSNPLFFASKNSVDIYLKKIEELMDMLEKEAGHTSWFDRLENLVAPEKKVA